MNEEFLHYLWKYRVFPGEVLTVSGDRLEVLRPGEHNTGGGPDFLNARIRIGDTLWAGNVEIHVNSSDWYRHRHQEDPAYQNIILHVVFRNDAVVTDPKGTPFQTFVLDGTFPESAFHRYRAILDNKSWIPCERMMPDADPEVFRQWSHALTVERLEQKCRTFRESWELCAFNWDETFLIQLARSLGFSINSIPFEMLMRSIPFRILAPLRQDLLRTEALLFGQAGFLEGTAGEEYPEGLRRLYSLIREKNDLQPVPAFLWKFLRLRPSNFPTVRIAQLAALLNRQEDLFGVILSSATMAPVASSLAARASDYWDTHYHFGKLSAVQPKILGAASVNLLMVNFVIPFLFFYGKEKNSDEHCRKALQWLEMLPAERNSELSRWKDLGMPVESAIHTQALIRLKVNYCDPRRCLECRIGSLILLNRKS
jgi:hypothetical protein